METYRVRDTRIANYFLVSVIKSAIVSAMPITSIVIRNVLIIFYSLTCSLI